MVSELYNDTNETELTKEQREEKVYNLEVELAEAVMNKKSFVSAANDNIKRIKAEIKDLVKQDLKVLSL